MMALLIVGGNGEWRERIGWLDCAGTRTHRERTCDEHKTDRLRWAWQGVKVVVCSLSDDVRLASDRVFAPLRHERKNDTKFRVPCTTSILNHLRERRHH